VIKVVRGDITSQATDAIVNAANTHLIAGGGVCGAIHRVAGPELEIECRKIGGCPIGEARLTRAYDLPCRHVIHAVGPRYSYGTRGESEILTRCYQSIFALTEEHRIESISIPAISTGIFHYPVKEATEIAFATTLLAQEKQNLLVQFVCFDEDTTNIYEKIYTQL
jgi:O-acetyl-ADP-ribose deacetylase (regulator of RNase III)